MSSLRLTRYLSTFLLLAPAIAAPQPAAAQTKLTIDPGVRHQTIEGFGTSLATWMPDMVEFYRQESFPSFYLEELGANVLRIDLWNECAPLEKENWAEISYRDFTFEGPGARGGVFVEIAERLQAQSGGTLRIIATAWSPPPWMKINRVGGNGRTDRQNIGLRFENAERGLWFGPLSDDPGGEHYEYVGRNKLRPDRYLHYAKLLVEWTRYFRSKGIELYGLSPQNEPKFSQWYSSCVYTPAEYAELLRVIDWMFRHEGVAKPRIYGPEHMTGSVEDNQLYLQAIFNQPDGGRLIDILASHGYLEGVTMDSRPESMSAFAQFGRIHGKPVWMTEGGTGSHAWPLALNQTGVIMMAALSEGNASLVTPWQIVDRQANTHALMPVAGPSKKTYTMMQYWRFIRPGMVRIGVDGDSSTLKAVAFVDPATGKLVVVLLNRAITATRIHLSFASSTNYRISRRYLTDATHNCAATVVNDSLNLEVPGESLTTLLLSPAQGSTQSQRE